MAKRISDIAKELGIPSKAVIDKCVAEGIPSDKAREIVKFIKDARLKKVQAAIQGDQLRITSASKDELQEVMRLLREQDFGVALQFGNYRG